MRPAMCCASVFRAPNGSRSTIPAPATRPRTAFARRSEMRTLLGLLPPSQRAAATSSIFAGYEDYVINAEALAYMRQRALSGPVIASLAEHPDRVFANKAAWTAHLDRLGIAALKVNPDPVMVATEGALWGSIKAHGFLPDTVIVSDDAGQFNVGQHGLCWVHAERLIHKLDTFTDDQRKAQARIRGLIWPFYRDLKLKAYRQNPTR